MTDNHTGRALRPLRVSVPLKAGTSFEVHAEGDVLNVSLARTFDFEVELTVENYGTLVSLIDVLVEAKEAELQRINASSSAARNERSRSYKREPTTPNPGLPEKTERKKRRRRVR